MRVSGIVLSDAFLTCSFTINWLNFNKVCVPLLHKGNGSLNMSRFTLKITMSKRQRMDLSNQKFGMLTVVSYHKIKNRKHYWICKCDCGNFASVQDSNLRSMSVWHCGCMKGNAGKGKIAKLISVPSLPEPITAESPTLHLPTDSASVTKLSEHNSNSVSNHAVVAADTLPICVNVTCGKATAPPPIHIQVMINYV